MKKLLNLFSVVLFIFGSVYFIIFSLNQSYLNDYKLKKLNRSQVGNLQENYVTIFTAYYKLSRSKHSHNQYDNWTITFLTSVSVPIVIFTDDYSLPKFKNWSSKLNLSVTFFVTKDIWDLMEMIEEWRSKKYIEIYKTKQHIIDPKKWLHNPNLYAVWNSKHFMAKIVLEQNPYKSDFFIYTDMGAWRQKKFNNWPDLNFVKNLSIYLNDSALYGQIYRENMKNFNPMSAMIEGGFIAGSKRALFKIIDAYYKIHDEWLDKELFVGNDQSIMNEVAFKINPKIVKRLRTWGHWCIKNYDRWFFYQYFLNNNNNINNNQSCTFNLQNSILN